MRKSPQFQSGFTMVEVLIGSALVVSFALASMTVFRNTLELMSRSTRSMQAVYLAEEGIEALKVMRDNGRQTNIASLTASTTYYLAYDAATWKATTTNVFIDNTFERKFVRQTVRRDATTKDIISSGGSVDASTTQMTVTVSWRAGSATTSRSISTYLTNLFQN